MPYIMVTAVLDEHADTLGKLRSGRSCVEWKASKTLSLEALTKLAPKMLREAGERASG